MEGFLGIRGRGTLTEETNQWCLINDLQLLLGQFIAENEAARVKISFSKFKNMGPPQLERTVGFVYQSI